ncbi:MAG: hypothetical protein PHX51_08070 [Clostridia bacterium]|nr:hypothetical protein [Clostridia bacterium]
MRARQRQLIGYKSPGTAEDSLGSVTDDWSEGTLKTAYSVYAPATGQARIAAYGESIASIITLNLLLDCDIKLNDGVWLDISADKPFGKVVNEPRRYLRHIEADVKSL